ncbi:glycoside hydrolase [Bacteroidota bacterium]|nr:glycoside hydrolase [Bacteroidota bacterium]
MKKILWLVSWYPNRFDLFNADFIQHQAEAVSKFVDVHVLYVHADETGAIKKTEATVFQKENLTEQIIYYPSESKNILGKIKSINRYYKISKLAIQQYIKKNGLPDYVHVHVPIRAGAVALWMKKKYGISYALTEHYGIYNRTVIDPWEERSFVYRNSVKRIIKNAEPFICVSNQLGEDVNRLAIKKEFVSIPNVVDVNHFHFIQKKNENKKFRFIHVSNMIPLKNVEGIIDAAKTLSKTRNDFVVKIIGRTSSTIINYAEQSGLLNQTVFFSGEIPYTQVANEMNEANAFILFSRSESSSCVVQESLCCGLPIISTQVGIALKTVNETNGLFAEIDNANSLAEKMNEIINNYSKYNREQISKESCQKFNYETIGRKIVNSYNF